MGRSSQRSSLAREAMAFILAGGRGERLHELTESQAKPCLPFGGSGRVIDFAISNAMNSGIGHIGVAVQYQAQGLVHHLQQSRSRLQPDTLISLSILSPVSRYKNSYSGTADAIYQNLEKLQSHKPRYLIILAGDHIYKMNYEPMLQKHINTGADVTLSCIPVPFKDAHRFGIVKVDKQDRVISFVEKPDDGPSCEETSKTCLASMGIYVFTFDFLIDQLQRDAHDPHSQHDFGIDLIPCLVRHGNVIAHHFEQSCIRSHQTQEIYWRDIGALDSYWQANLDLTQRNPAFDLYDHDWPIWSLRNDARPGLYSDDERKSCNQICESVISSACNLKQACVRRSLLCSGACLESSVLLAQAIILPDVKIGRNARLTDVIVDSSVKIPDGLIVGEDPDLDAKRFRRTESGLCLITQKMIDRLH